MVNVIDIIHSLKESLNIEVVNYNIDENTKLYPDGPFEIDSLDIVELTNFLEEKYDVDLDDIDRENLVNLGELAKFISSKLENAMVKE